MAHRRISKTQQHPLRGPYRGKRHRRQRRRSAKSRAPQPCTLWSTRKPVLPTILLFLFFLPPPSAASSSAVFFCFTALFLPSILFVSHILISPCLYFVFRATA